MKVFKSGAKTNIHAKQLSCFKQPMHLNVTPPPLNKTEKKLCFIPRELKRQQAKLCLQCITYSIIVLILKSRYEKKIDFFTFLRISCPPVGGKHVIFEVISIVLMRNCVLIIGYPWTLIANIHTRESFFT